MSACLPRLPCLLTAVGLPGGRACRCSCRRHVCHYAWPLLRAGHQPDRRVRAAAHSFPLLHQRRLVVGGATYLAAYEEGAGEGALRAFALQYCQQRNASFGAAGAVRRGALPRVLGAHAAALATYSPLAGAVCEGAGCPFIAVLECVPQGSQPCVEDSAGNIG